MKDAFGSSYNVCYIQLPHGRSPAPSRTPGLAAIEYNTRCSQSLSRLARALPGLQLVGRKRATRAVLMPTATASFTPAPHFAPN